MSTDGYEDYVLKERRRRYEKEYARNNPNRARSELGNPMHQYGRNGDFYRPRSGRNSAFQELRETSSSDELELVAGPANIYNNYYSGGTRNRRADKWKFTESEIAFFMTIGLHPDHARRILRDDPPPAGFYELDPVIKAGYLFYHEVYNQYFQRDLATFTKRFYREFYKYLETMTEEEALYKICEHTRREYDRNQQRIRALTLAEGRATPDSRTSLPSYEDSDSFSLEPAAKEPLKFRTHHMNVRFAPNGRLLILNPQKSVTSVEVRYLKNMINDIGIKRNLEIIEAFKGPLLYNETQPHTLLPFIEQQIQNIFNSDVYRGNPDSNDTNDCLLIWRLLQMLVKQQGRVTGPDLAQLLIGNENDVRATVSRINAKQTTESESDLSQCTYFLVRGCVDDAINSAVRQGCLFDALILAESLYANKPEKLASIKSSLMATRSAAHPLTTLNSVAAAKPVPLLASANTDDGRGWRVHVAILLANLKTSAAYESIYQLGLDLARREFDSAADFCFLAVNLLSGRNCFESSGQSLGYRQHVGLIKATLPDDEVHAARTRFGWSILDFCATEIFEYTIRLANGGQPNALSQSIAFQQSRWEYAELLDELGGFSYNTRAYRQQTSGQPIHYQPTMVQYPASQMIPPQPQPVAQKPSIPQTSPRQRSLTQDSSSERHSPIHERTFQSFPQSFTQPLNQSFSKPLAQPPVQPPVQPPIPNPVQAPIQPLIQQQHQSSPPKAEPQTPSIASEAPEPTPFFQHYEAPNYQQNYRYPTDLDHTDDYETSTQHSPLPTPQFVEQPYQSPFSEPTPPTPIQQQSPAVETQQSSQQQASQLIRQRIAASEPKQEKQSEKSKQGGSGLLGGLLSKFIPGSNQMILPDDSKLPENERLRYDESLGRWVGGGIEEESAPPPPPAFQPMPQAQSIPQVQTMPQVQAMPNVSSEQPNNFVAAQPNAQPPTSLKPSNSMRKGPNRYYNAANWTAPTASSMAPPDFPSMIPPTVFNPPIDAGD
ncbi:Protein transport protein sec16 [Aphelenchoides besseyi]|nr:Protein transport protein sec16 [Aphelenchoides besseyi]